MNLLTPAKPRNRMLPQGAEVGGWWVGVLDNRILHAYNSNMSNRQGRQTPSQPKTLHMIHLRLTTEVKYQINLRARLENTSTQKWLTNLIMKELAKPLPEPLYGGKP